MRRNEREYALKILFACEFGDNIWEKHKGLFKNNELKHETEFSRTIIKKYLENQADIDDELKPHIQNWDFSRVAIIDKIILRISMIELLYCPEIPPEATLNEAIEMAKKFSTPQSSVFVNGVLDSVFKSLKSELEKIKKGRGKVSKILN